jgi:hypothetical protein
MRKNISGQKWLAYAFHRTTGAPITGDAANITGQLRKDYGAAAALATPNPTELDLGYYEFALTAGETNADVLHLLVQSSTANVQAVACEIEKLTGAISGNELAQLRYRLGIDGASMAPSASEHVLDDATIDGLARDISSALASIQLSVQSQITLAGGTDLNVIQGDDYTRAGTRIDLDTSNLPNPNEDLSSKKFIVAAKNGSTKIAVRMPIVGAPGSHYCFFDPPASLTETWPEGVYNILYRLEWAADEYETLNASGVLTVAAFDIEPGDLVDI